MYLKVTYEVIDVYTVGNIKLSKRQSQVLFYILRSYTSKDIAKKLGIKYRTVDHHNQKAKEKFGFHYRREIVRFSYKKALFWKIPHSLVELEFPGLLQKVANE